MGQELVKYVRLRIYCEMTGLSVVWVRRMLEKQHKQILEFKAAVRVPGPGPGCRWLIDPTRFNEWMEHHTQRWSSKQS